MKKRNICYRLLVVVLSFAMCMQGGFVMPVFADGDFSYYLQYNEATNGKISEEHPIIIPDEDIDTEYGAQPHDNYQGTGGVIDEPIPDWSSKPYRIIGYTFDGWYTENNGGGTRVDENTNITSSMLDRFNHITLYGKWSLYNSPDITTGSVEFSSRNGNDEDIPSQINWTDISGNNQTFNSDITDYYTYVYANTASVKMEFEQYEPSASTSVAVNGENVKISSSDINGKGYWYNGEDLKSHNIVTGKNISTEYMDLDFTTNDKEYNEITVTVTMPNNNSKTYTFHIKRLSTEMRLEYGNTPYGKIMASSQTADAKASLKSTFNSTYKYRNISYNPLAWNIYGSDGVEVKKGTSPQENEYINYDKDETAIIVYSGDRFTDPGVTLYDLNGDTVELTQDKPIKRTIRYQTVDTLKYEDWDKTTDKTDVKNLVGADNENVIDILKTQNVKPGIYTISYEYDPNDGTRPLKDERSMIVLPKKGDMNMDNYVNMLDVFMYDKNIPDTNISNTLYKYRALDISTSGGDGVVDTTDRNNFLNKKIAYLYPSLSVAETVTQADYNVPTSADNNKVQLYMDFMGTATEPDSSADKTQELQKNDVFWVGYRFDNTANLKTGNLKEITLSVDYDSRYVNPTALTNAALKTQIQKNNPNLAVFDITGDTNYKKNYAADSSTASYTWNDTSAVKTLVIELCLKDGQTLNLSDGYFIKLPFKVKTVPLEGRNIISTKLGATSLNLQIGYDGYMWDTSGVSNSITENLMDKLQYMGDYVPEFVPEEPAKELDNAVYGTDKSYTGFEKKGTVDGDIPTGMKYNQSVGTITGVPTKAGVFVFYINGVKYQITVEKAKLTVTADDNTKVYGSANPSFTFKYDETCLRNGDTIANAVKTAPQISCAADTTTDCQTDYPINFVENSGVSDNYYFDFVRGKLNITPKEITVSKVKIPSCSINATFPYTFTATCAGDEFTATGIINNDSIKIEYDVKYNDTETTKSVGKNKKVTATSIRVKKDTDYPDGSNYTIKSATLNSSDGEIVADNITEFEVTEECTLEYTYGEPLNLKTGNIRITYGSGTVENVTFKEAVEKGLTIKYSNKATAKTGDHLSVSDSGKWLVLTMDGISSWYKTNNLKINKKDLHLKADDKQRYYGDENSTVSFTYTFNNSDFVYNETSSTFTGFIAPQFNCQATATTEIDKEKGYTESTIEMSGGSSDNYNIVCENGILKINKRPLKIEKITDEVPSLISKYYLNSDGTEKTAPYKVPASAEKSETKNTMNVSGLCNGDEVKVLYNAQYANHTATENVQITVADLKMDDTFGKSYNYTVSSDSTTVADGGRVYIKSITGLEIVEQPTTEYVYGTPLNLKSGKVKLTFDNEQVINVNFEELKAYDVKLTYTGGNVEPQNNEHLVVKDSGKSITVTPDTFYNVDSVTTNEITVTKHELHVKADDVYTTYGENISQYSSGYGYTYTESDFQYDDVDDVDNITGYIKPVISCKEDDGTTNVNQKTLAGTYVLSIGGADAENYKILYENGTLVIRQRPLIVQTVNNIPNLTSKEAFEGNLVKNIDVKTDVDSLALTFAENKGLLWNDSVHITFDATYTDSSAVGETDVDITNAVLDTGYGAARNYYLQKIETPQKGFVAKSVMTKIEIVTDPTQDDDGNSREYKYGDTLDFSHGKFKLTYDNGDVIDNVPFDKLAEYDVKAIYTGTDKEVVDGAFATIQAHNGKTITLVPPLDATTDEVVTGAITVNKRPLHVLVNDAAYIYGDEPCTYTIDYNKNDLADGETIISALGTIFTPPTIQCKIGDKATDNTTAAGTYENVITASGGSADNYEFICEDKGSLTINKRELKINSINKGIPDLTSSIAYEHNYQLPIKLDGTASNSDMDIINLVNNDSIDITYKAVYNSLEQTDSATVGIENVEFSADCDSSKNYILATVPTTSNGKVMTRLMSEIVVNQSPDKMEYTYGEWFALKGGSVDIKYNSGYVESNVPFERLADFGIDLTFVKKDTDGSETEIGAVKNNILLTVSKYNGAVIKLTISDPTKATNDLQVAYSDNLIVNKHQMRVIADDVTLTYGDNAPSEYTFHYSTADLVNGDTLSSERFNEGLIAPTVSCEYVSGQSVCGEYDIVPSGGGNDNYNFVYENGTVTVNKKQITINSINSGVPILTSEIIYKNNSVLPIYIASTAVYTNEQKNMTVSGIINNDEIGITYDAVYTSKDVAQIAVVKIENVKFDESHEKNMCYEIVSSPNEASGGAVLEEQITSVVITSDPVLRDDNGKQIEYTYGDKLNLNRGAVTVEYDSGRIQKNLKFNELAEKTDGKVKTVYTDGDNETPAADNDVLTTSYHNGKSIKLKVETKATVEEPQTAQLLVNKAVVTVTAKDKEKFYGDKNPTLEYEYSGFVNGDDEHSENFKKELKEPVISCNANEKTPIGTYEIELSSAISANYSFKLVPATLTINKRPIDVKKITGGIPELTSKMIYDNPQLVYKIDGIAINTSGQVEYENLSYGDTVKIGYTVMYTSTISSDNVLVNIYDIKIDDTYGEGNNYVLRDVPSTTLGGRICDKQISMVEIIKQPKLEYTYGETLDLSEKGVRITYDSGLQVYDVAYDELKDYGIDVILTDSNDVEKEATDGEKLTVTQHNGAYLTLIPRTELSNIPSVKSQELKINKKAINVNIGDVTATYGDNPTSDFNFVYNSADFVYGETSDSAEFKDNLTEPVFVCKERDGSTDVSLKSDVGRYTIAMTGAQSDNYRFVYNNGTLTIQKRKLVIKDIMSDIPILTSDIIFNNQGQIHKLDGKADNDILSLDNLVNNDNVRILYKAIYKTEQPTPKCDVDIEYISMDGTYGKSYNYEIDENESVKNVDGGKVNDREITTVEIVSQPKTEYTYGEKIDLSNAKAKITYDSGYVEDNVPFSKLENYGVTIGYPNDDGTITPAKDGDVLTVPNHNGKCIEIIAQSTHKVPTVQTDNLTVEKRVLEYGQCVVNPITYDGSTMQTTGTIVFANVQNNDKVTATGEFLFEDYNAGNDKTVSITNIKLDKPFDDNYTLSSDNVMSKGNINKATLSVSLAENNISISDESNTLTIIAPEMTQFEEIGGAKYQYSIDGGKTWQEENVFENLDLGQECDIRVRFAETDNFNQSEMSVPISKKAFANKITLISIDDMAVLKSFYTNVATVEREAEFRNLIGDVGVTYYDCYKNDKGSEVVKYPLTFDGDVVIYTTLKKKSSHGKGSNGSSNPSAKPTATPTISPTVEPTETDEPLETLKPTQKPQSDTNEPYMSGYDGEINPDGYMTRAEAATIMVNLSGGIEKQSINIFKDVADGTWYKNYIAAASEKGYISGFEDGTFKPEESVTREQFVAMMLRYTKTFPTRGETFSDVSINRWSAGYIYTAVELGIISGYQDGTFKPENPVTRAEAARIVNVATGRNPNKEVIDNMVCPYSDLPKSHWAYYELMYASTYVYEN